MREKCSSFSAIETGQKPFFAVVGEDKKLVGMIAPAAAWIRLWLTLSLHSIGAAGGNEQRTCKFSCI